KSVLLVVDGTLGAAGHSKEMLWTLQPQGFVLGLDRDPQVAELAARELINAGFTRGKQFEVEVRRFSEFDLALANRSLPGFDRLLLDLGVCSLHLDTPERGFSLKREGLLDMRLNPQEPGSQSAADVVNEADERDLARIFWTYGEERFGRQVARAIVARRRAGAIRTTHELREVVAGAIPRRAWPPQVDVATRVFQALRIEVNRELEELEVLLGKLPGLMKPGSRAGIISFHSLEDRRVKEAFRDMARECICPPEQPVCNCGRKKQFRVLTAKPAVADEAEVNENPRSRSAKLRVIERLETAES
ncbi:MAG: 16S rRNA (cytosine(1402)-N(4))-methyltransferase RsmH, partial [Candidatus Sumerlaeaceae bacterium]|nr:16S rRNA (cytosine(1402)-N(4))-methyltransferase RsmH [Candidatus Sumerlaeaceae bacterium]